ncbi:MAG: OB-fold nucleic acid binding domain-containing protein, partial [Fusobacteriaceae bacterium]
MNRKYMELYRPFSELELDFLKERELKDLKKLKKLGIDNVFQLLNYFPRSYDNRTNLKKISELGDNEYVVIKGEVLTCGMGSTFNNKKIVKARINDGSGIIELTWFSAPYISKALKIGEEYYFIGMAKRGSGFQMVNPEFKNISAQKRMEEGEILPIYSTTKDISQNWLRGIIGKFLNSYLEDFEENIPQELIKKYRISKRKTSLQIIHFPKKQNDLEEAKRRFAIEELLILEMGILG